MRYALTLLFLVGCATPQGVSNTASKYIEGVQQSSGEPLAVLSWTAGLSILAGMALLVITSGRKGKFPLLGGVGLVLLNYLVARYDDFLFYPLVICTGIISIAWTYKIVKQIHAEKTK
tara:strand:+ start:5525 stop:5878 length:354 start_codon:yes stop_codon:yes gene_type:complete